VAAFKDKLALENNTTMAAAEKTEKLAAAEARLRELDLQIAALPKS